MKKFIKMFKHYVKVYCEMYVRMNQHLWVGYSNEL